MIDRDKLIAGLHASLLRDTDYIYCGGINVRVVSLREGEFSNPTYVLVQSVGGAQYQPPVHHWLKYSVPLDE